MKRYKRFMDGVRASDTLNQRLKALKEPKKKPAWTKYGAMAAALVLVCGLGWYGLNYWQTMNRQRFLERAQVYHPEEPGVSYQPGPGTYEYHDPRLEGLGVASFIVLPDIEYTQAGNPNRYTVAADWDLPQGALRRDMSREHIAYLLGGEDALSTHLDWDGYELSGWAAWYGNGDFWGAYIQGYAGELDHFEFAVTANQLPPTCFEFPDVGEQNIHGLMVTAVGYDSTASTRQVSFMKDGYGYRFDLTGTDRELAEQRVSRLVRWVADDSGEWTKEAQALTVIGNGTYTCEVCGRDYPVGSAHGHPFMGGDTSDAYPAVSADPSYSAPPVSAEPSYTCPDCGASYPAGTDHQCEICGYPLAPDTHVCEVCGQTIPAGVEHSHQQEHHQEQHHGNHH